MTSAYRFCFQLIADWVPLLNILPAKIKKTRLVAKSSGKGSGLTIKWSWVRVQLVPHAEWKI